MGWCTAQCKMPLLCVKTIVKESCNFELSHLQKKKKKRKRFWLFDDFPTHPLTHPHTPYTHTHTHTHTHPRIHTCYSEESNLIRGVGVDKMMECGKLDHLKNGPIYWVDSADINPCMGEEVVSVIVDCHVTDMSLPPQLRLLQQYGR